MLEKLVDIALVFLASAADDLPVFCVCKAELARRELQWRCMRHARALALDDVHETLGDLCERKKLVVVGSEYALLATVGSRAAPEILLVRPNGSF